MYKTKTIIGTSVHSSLAKTICEPPGFYNYKEPIQSDRGRAMRKLRLRSPKAQISMRICAVEQCIRCSQTELLNTVERFHRETNHPNKTAHVHDDMNPYTLRMIEGTFLLDAAGPSDERL